MAACTGPLTGEKTPTNWGLGAIPGGVWRPGLGIDTVRWGGLIYPNPLHLPYGTRVRDLDPKTGEINDQIRLRLTNAAILHVLCLKGRVYGSIETSIPKLLGRHNIHLASVDETLSVMPRLYELATDFVTWMQPFDESVLRRIDIALDMEPVPDLGLLLHALHVDPLQRSTTTFTTGIGGALTLKRGPADRRLVLYDKGVEVRSKDRGFAKNFLGVPRTGASALLRIEYRLRGAALERMGCEQASNLRMNYPRLCDEHRLAFSEMGFGNTVTSFEAYYDLLRSDTSMSPALRRGLIGYVVQLIHGDDPGASHNTKDRYNRRLRKLGIAPSNQAATIQHGLRLDYDRQRQVTVTIGEDDDE